MNTLFGNRLSPLFYAIGMVESDNGATSENVYQLTEVYYRDVVRICKDSRLPDIPPFDRVRVSPPLSQACMETYWNYYGSFYLLSHPGKRINYEWLARVHNGGPYGYEKPQTKPYWLKVQKYLLELEDAREAARKEGR